MRRLFILATMLAIGAAINSARACTGITLHSADGATITARTIEWAGNDLKADIPLCQEGIRSSRTSQEERRRNDLQG